MTRLEKRIFDILNGHKEFKPKTEEERVQLEITKQELISTFRIYLEQRDNFMWGKTFEGVGSAMRRAKAFDYNELERQQELL